MAARHGILVVDKPEGPTSHDVVSRVRRAFKQRRVGHAGTLDPMATGILVVAVGEATKLVPYLTAADKRYEATIRLGIATDSLDAKGTTTEERDVPEVVRAWLESGASSPRPSEIDDALERERARREQVPPVFSAIHVNGRRSHELARAGQAVALPPRPVELLELEITGAGHSPFPELHVALRVSKGYYVRALARDIAESLGTVGHLTALRRTSSGAFTLDDAVTLAQLTADSAPPLLSLSASAARVLPTAVLTARGVEHARTGKVLEADDFGGPAPMDSPAAWLDSAGALVAIGRRIDHAHFRAVRGFHDEAAPGVA